MTEALQYENVFRDKELSRRIRERWSEIWYVDVLAQGDVTKIDAVRGSRFIDAMRVLRTKIRAAR